MEHSSINQNFDLIVEIISPVHVGAEQRLVKGIDYFYDESQGKVYVINLNQLYKKSVIDEDELTDILLEGELDIDTFKGIVGDRIDEITQFDYSLNLEEEIRPFIKDAFNNPYIPGSSLKGAIVSAFIGGYIQSIQSNVVLKNIFNEKKSKAINEKKIKALENLVGEDFLGKIGKNNASESINTTLMSLLKISDVYTKKTNLLPTRTFNLVKKNNIEKEPWKASWKIALYGEKNHPDFEDHIDKFCFAYECVHPDESNVSSLRIGFASKIAENRTKDRVIIPTVDSLITKNPLNNLFSLINLSTKSHIEKEIKFFKEHLDDDIDEAKVQNIINAYKLILEQIPSDNNDSCMLRLGAGVGFHAITGDWRFSNHNTTLSNPDTINGLKHYKSRKLAFEDRGERFMPMGFIKLYTHDAYDNEIKIKAEKQSNTTVSESLRDDAPFTRISLHEVTPETIIEAKVIALKPNKKVIIYFEEGEQEVQLGMGVYRKEPLEIGQKIKVKISNQTDSKINMVSFHK